MSHGKLSSGRAAVLPLLLALLGGPPLAAAAVEAADADVAAAEGENVEELKARLQAVEEQLRQLQEKLAGRPDADTAELARQ